MFSGEYANAQSVYDDALSLVPNDRRRDTVASVVEPLRNYVTAGVLNGELLDQVKNVIGKLDAVLGQPANQAP
jgi:hypothetical protein